MSALFITATGTGVGKTLVTCALAWQSRQQGRPVTALKPIVTGYGPGTEATSDTHLILAALGETPTEAAVRATSPWRFAAPLAPDAAAARENTSIDFGDLVGFCQTAMEDADDFVIIEGIGGAFVPLAGERTVADWIAALDIPCMVVAGSYLGSLSHTIATLEAMRARELRIARVVINASTAEGLPVDDTAAALAPFLGTIPVSRLPRIDVPEQRWRQAPEIPVPELG